MVRNNFSEFAESFSQLIRVGEDKIRAVNQGCRILFTVDGTDRLNSEDARKFLTITDSVDIQYGEYPLVETGTAL